ncbi:MAG: hypothetical protein DRI83_11285, partial [Bacteroidetes bacterium]
ADRNLDFIIGSVHFVGQFKNQANCCIDDTKEDFEKTLELVFNNDIKKLRPPDPLSGDQLITASMSQT